MNEFVRDAGVTLVDTPRRPSLKPITIVHSPGGTIVTNDRGVHLQAGLLEDDHEHVRITPDPL